LEMNRNIIADALHREANDIVDKLKTARLKVVRLSTELVEAEYALRVVQAKVERGLIKRVGGEKSLAPTSEDRARIYILALDADQDYKDILKRRNQAEASMEEAKADLSYLRDRLNVILSTLRTLKDTS